MLTTLAQVTEKGWWMPVGGSTFAEEVDWAFMALLWISLFFFVIVGVAMFWFAWKYRMRPGDEDRVAHGSHHNNTLEITWSVIPLIIVLAIFVWGFRGYLDMVQPQDGAYQIQVNAKKWNWEFVYPEGNRSPFLHLPADRPVQLILNSSDVIHSFFVPAFRTKKDIVPGRYNKVWLQARWDLDAAREAGTVTVTIPNTDREETYSNVLAYDLFCTEYCGTFHSWMTTSAIVHTEAGFQRWLATYNPYEGLDPVDAGAEAFQLKGCNACHSTDGSPGVGPSFRDLFGREENIVGQDPVLVNEDYIVESIRQPAAKIVAGYANQMPVAPVTNEEIDYLIAWMKSISEHSDQTLEQLNQGGAQPAEPADALERESTRLPPQHIPTLEEARDIPSQDVPDQGIEPGNND